MFSEAAELYERALKMVESTMGPCDPLMAIVLENLGAVYDQTSERNMAEDCRERASKIKMLH
jgi:hypothetical protein